jgi:DNA repair ATPase RecN
VASSSRQELERRVARLGERTHAAAQHLHSLRAELRRTLAAGVRDVTDSRALVGAAFAIAAAVAVWAGLRREAHMQRRRGTGRTTRRARC